MSSENLWGRPCSNANFWLAPILSLGVRDFECPNSLTYSVEVLYAVGIVELELESTSALILLLFIIPLAFTLSGFLMWILYSLNGKGAL